MRLPRALLGKYIWMTEPITVCRKFICSLLFFVLCFFYIWTDIINPTPPSPFFRVVGFDVTNVERNSSTLVKAEFRIYRIPNPQARATEQRVEVYQVITGPFVHIITSVMKLCDVSQFLSFQAHRKHMRSTYEIRQYDLKTFLNDMKTLISWIWFKHYQEATI